MCGVHAVENRWNLVTPVGAGHQQEAQFIDEIRLEEGTVRFGSVVLLIQSHYAAGRCLNT
jgi:hypothetical protein